MGLRQRGGGVGLGFLVNAPRFSITPSPFRVVTSEIPKFPLASFQRSKPCALLFVKA